MKIVAVLESRLAAGGGFNQALNALRQLGEVCAGRFELEILTPHAENVRTLAQIGLRAEAFEESLLDRLISFLVRSAWWPTLQLRLRLKGALEKRLERHGCDLAWFVDPSSRAAALQDINFVATVWDACHRDFPEFPEGRSFAMFQLREQHLAGHLAAAILILTDSPELSTRLTRRYGLDPERLLVMPFAPAPTLSPTAAEMTQAVLQRHGLEPGYFFYPAQLWAHKNHVRIVEALALLKRLGHVAHAVFAGKDGGNRAHVERVAQRLGVSAQVRFLGFVAADDMSALYAGSAAVVMPTYYGPTNLPPMEAWLAGKPLVYTSYFAAQAGEAALLADPDDAQALADALRACLDPEVCARLAKAGRIRLDEVLRDRARAQEELLARLVQFESRRKCWP